MSTLPMTDDRWQRLFSQKDIEYKQSLSSSSFHPRTKQDFDQTKSHPAISLSQSQKVPNSNSMLTSSSFVASEDMENQLEMDFPTDLQNRKYSRKFMLDLAREYPLPEGFQMVESITSEETLLPVRKQLKQDDDAKLKMYNDISSQKLDKDSLVPTTSILERVEVSVPTPLPFISTTTAIPTVTATPKQEDSLWFYLDPKKVQQGPFTSTQMEKWLKQNFFRLDLWVKKMEENVFSPLYLVFQRENRNPFTLVPLSQWLVQNPPSVFQQEFIKMLSITRSSSTRSPMTVTGTPSMQSQHANNSNLLLGDTANPVLVQNPPPVPAPTAMQTTHTTLTNQTQTQELTKQTPARLPQKKKQYREKQNPNSTSSSLNEAQLVSNPYTPHPQRQELFPPPQKPVAIKK